MDTLSKLSGMFKLSRKISIEDELLQETKKKTEVRHIKSKTKEIVDFSKLSDDITTKIKEMNNLTEGIKIKQSTMW